MINLLSRNILPKFSKFKIRNKLLMMLGFNLISLQYKNIFLHQNQNDNQ